MSSKSNSIKTQPDEWTRRAVKKFGPGRWRVTSRSLQQATPWQVADQKAAWLADDVVYDLCCGLGGDAMAFAKRGKVIAVDRDPDLTKLTRWNLAQVAAVEDFEIWNLDVSAALIPQGASIHIDPDRRVGGSRTTQPDYYQPPWDDVCRIVARAKSAIIKMAPAAHADDSKLPPIHRCWISLQGSVREQSVLCGQAIERAGLTPGERSALSLAADGTPQWYRPRSATDEVANPAASSADTLPTCPQAMRYLIDPNAAIRAAGLTETFAREHGLHALHQASGFFTADHLPDVIRSIALTGEVVWSGACDDRRLRREFRSLNVYPQTIKVRATGHDPASLVKRYRSCGDMPITLWIGRAGKRVFAAMTRPV